MLRHTVPVPSLSIFPAGNMQRKDISGLFVQIFTGPECATCIPPCSHREPLPSYLLHPIFFPVAAFPSLQTAQDGGGCRKKWSFPHLHSWKRGRRTACTVNTCIICPICSHLVLLKFFDLSAGFDLCGKSSGIPTVEVERDG